MDVGLNMSTLYLFGMILLCYDFQSLFHGQNILQMFERGNRTFGLTQSARILGNWEISFTIMKISDLCGCR